MKNRGGWRRCAVVLGMVVAALFLLVVGAASIYLLARQAAGPGIGAPMVTVSEPLSGTTFAQGEHFIVLSNSGGSRAVARVEVWLDGDLKATQNSQRAEGYRSFDSALPVALDAAGPHLLFVRAIDTSGLIGQSQPLTPNNSNATGRIAQSRVRRPLHVSTARSASEDRLMRVPATWIGWSCQVLRSV